MRGKYRSGGARPARSRPPPATGCVRSHVDVGEGPAPTPPGPVHPAVPAGVRGATAPPPPPTGPVCPDVTPSGRSRLPVCGQTGPWSPVACATARGVPGARRRGCERSAGGAIERLRVPGRRGRRPRHPRAGTRAPPQASADAVTPPRAGLVNRVGTGSYRAGAEQGRLPIPSSAPLAPARGEEPREGAPSGESANWAGCPPAAGPSVCAARQARVPQTSLRQPPHIKDAVYLAF